MADLEIGRFGADFDIGVQRWDDPGHVVNVSGVYTATSWLEARAARQQLVGYVDNPDVEVVPVSWPQDHTVSGFYRVRRATVDAVPASKVHYRVGWSASLEKLPTYAVPLLESTVVGNIRDNNSSVTSAKSWLVVPPGTSAFDQYVAAGLDTVATADGDAAMYTNSETGAFDYDVTWTLSPLRFFDAGASLQWDIGSSTWRNLVGRKIPNVIGMDVVDGWRLQNGLVRMTEGSSAGTFDLSHWDGSQWDTAKTFKIELSTGSLSLSVPLSMSVLRNTPGKVAVRFVHAVASSATVNVDVSLRRGSHLVEVNVSLPDGLTTEIGVVRASSEPATAITGGIRATSDDAAGNRYVILSPDAFTADTTDGGVTTTGQASASFAVGSEVGGSSASSPFTATDLVDRYFAAMDERVRVITR